MDHAADRHHPSSETIHDAVVDEDPSRWGARTSTTTPARPATYARSASTTTTTTATSAPPAQPPVRRPVFSLGATFLGWSCAAFFTLVFSAIAFALIGGDAALDGTIDLGALATTSFIAYLVASFLAYVIGGYAAGRISLWNGIWHGLGTVAWAVIFGIVGALASAYVADYTGLAPRLDFTGIGAAGLLAIVLSLLAMLAGGALGGRFGERYHETRRLLAERRRAVGGRPL